MFNLNLLQNNLTVEEYERVMSSLTYNPNWELLPAYVIARCPFCSIEYIERLDTYTFRKWRRIVTSVSTLSIFSYRLVIHHCEHLALVQTFFDFPDDLPDEGRHYIGHEAPYVIGHLLESDQCLAVIHALPICRIEADTFVPIYSLFMISYFSEQPQEAVQEVHRYNERWYSLEASATLYLPLQFGKPHWADLPYWVAKGQLYWVDGNDPGLSIRTQDVEAFPYRGFKT